MVKIGPDAAARALYEAEAAAKRSSVAASYWAASGKLFLWGGVWIVANVGGMLRIPYGGVVFPALLLIGIAGSLWFDLRASRRGDRLRSLLQSLGLAAAIVLLVRGVTVITGASSSLMATEAVICLAIGAAYVIVGGRIGWRLSAIGLAQMLGTMAVWLYAREQFFFWMAIVGGGGLLLGALWLRKA